MDFIPTWGSAIAQFEGFNDPANRAARNHNPGNLKFANQPGTIGKDPDNFAVFSDDASGFQALYRQLAKYVSDFPNYSILQITARYLGQPVPTVDQEGNAFTYANYVATQLGVDPDTTLGQLASGATSAVNTILDAVTPDPSNPGTGSSVVLIVFGGFFLWLLNRMFGGG
jgi:hypothetical protein